MNKAKAVHSNGPYILFAHIYIFDRFYAHFCVEALSQLWSNEP